MLLFMFHLLIFLLRCIFLGTFLGPTPVFLTLQNDVYTLSDKVLHDQVPLVLLPGTYLSPDRPTVGVLLARNDTDTAYQISKDYVTALTHPGIQLRFLTYDNIFEQARVLDGLVLVGGSFPSPPEWEDNPSHTSVSPRYLAYETLVRLAQDRDIPLLGTCAGMQVMAGVLLQDKMRLIPIPPERQALHRQDKNVPAHLVFFKDSSFLKELFGPYTMVNSIHQQAIPLTAFEGQDKVLPIGTALGDIVEAVAFTEHPNWIAFQWHPEVLAASGDIKQRLLWAKFLDDARTYFSDKKEFHDE